MSDQSEHRPAPIAIYEPPEADRGDVFADPAAFAHWQRVAKVFSDSDVIPEHLRRHLADVLIGLSLARRLRVEPLTVLQNLYVVKGTPGWKTSFLVALAQSAGWDLDYETEELSPTHLEWKRSTKNGPVPARAVNLRCRVVMTRGGKSKVGLWVSLEQAIAAKWADNEQYVHSTELMLGYRAAAFAIRRYDPNLLLGLQTEDEVRDMQHVVENEPAPTRGRAVLEAKLTQGSNAVEGTGDISGARARSVPSGPEPDISDSAKAIAAAAAELRLKTIASIDEWRAELPKVNVQAAYLAAGVQRVSLATSDERLDALLDALRGQAELLADAANKAAHDKAAADAAGQPGDDLPLDGVARDALLEQIAGLHAALVDEGHDFVVGRSADEAGLPLDADEMPVIDGASDAMLLRFRDNMLKAVTP